MFWEACCQGLAVFQKRERTETEFQLPRTKSSTIVRVTLPRIY